MGGEGERREHEPEAVIRGEGEKERRVERERGRGGLVIKKGREARAVVMGRG